MSRYTSSRSRPRSSKPTGSTTEDIRRDRECKTARTVFEMKAAAILFAHKKLKEADDELFEAAETYAAVIGRPIQEVLDMPPLGLPKDWR